MYELFRPEETTTGTPTKVDKSRASATINSLLELNQMKEKVQQLGDLGEHHEAMQQILTKVADESCQWVGYTVVNWCVLLIVYTSE